jgi:hypothetical protein
VSQIIERIRELVAHGDWRASVHALRRMAQYGIMASQLADRIGDADVVEDYPDYHAGPCVLVLQADDGGALHALWGLAQGTIRPAVLITAYRPDPAQWQTDNRTRK